MSPRSEIFVCLQTFSLWNVQEEALWLVHLLPWGAMFSEDAAEGLHTCHQLQHEKHQIKHQTVQIQRKPNLVTCGGDEAGVEVCRWVNEPRLSTSRLFEILQIKQLDHTLLESTLVHLHTEDPCQRWFNEEEEKGGDLPAMTQEAPPCGDTLYYSSHNSNCYSLNVCFHPFMLWQQKLIGQQLSST